MLPSASPATTIYILQKIKLILTNVVMTHLGIVRVDVKTHHPACCLQNKLWGEYFADLNYHFAWVKKASLAENKSEGYQRKLICQNIRPWVGGVLEGEATDVSNIWLLVEVVRAKTHT